MYYVYVSYHYKFTRLIRLYRTDCTDQLAYKEELSCARIIIMVLR